MKKKTLIITITKNVTNTFEKCARRIEKQRKNLFPR